MKLQDYTTATGLIPQLECLSLSEAVSRLVDGLVESGSIQDPERVVSEVLQREDEAHSAVGGGLVVPHVRSRAVSRLQIAAATLSQPLALPSEDDQPVDVVLLLVAPFDEPLPMLRMLSRLARLVMNSTFLEDLRAARTPAEMADAFPVSD